MKDYYKILGINETTNQDEIKKSYRKLAVQYHPDKNPDNKEAEEKFKEINEAYEILSDENKKNQYDNVRKYGEGVGNQFDQMDEILRRFGVNRGGMRRPNIKGQDLRINIEITLEEVYTGTIKNVKYRRRSPCETCSGTGGKQDACTNCSGSGYVKEVIRDNYGNTQISMGICPNCSGAGKIIKDPCVSCNGESWVLKDETLEINLPQGVEDGMMFAKKGFGNHVRNGTPGDLIIVIVEKPHDNFIRSGIDLTTNVKLTYPELVLGSEKEIKTIDGVIKINIPSNTKPNQVLRIRQKGLKINGSIGDLMLTINLEMPKIVNNEYKELLEKLKQINTN